MIIIPSTHTSDLKLFMQYACDSMAEHCSGERYKFERFSFFSFKREKFVSEVTRRGSMILTIPSYASRMVDDLKYS